MRRTVCLALAVLLAACSSPKPPPMSEQQAMQDLVPEVPVPIDGVYRGFGSVIRGGTMTCGTQMTITIEVRDNAFTYVLQQPMVPYRRSVRLSATIGDDGRFQGSSGTASIAGVVKNGHMEGELNGDACGYAFQADQGGNW